MDVNKEYEFHGCNIIGKRIFLWNPIPKTDADILENIFEEFTFVEQELKNAIEGDLVIINNLEGKFYRSRILEIKIFQNLKLYLVLLIDSQQKYLTDKVYQCPTCISTLQQPVVLECELLSLKPLFVDNIWTTKAKRYFQEIFKNGIFIKPFKKNENDNSFIIDFKNSEKYLEDYAVKIPNSIKAKINVTEKLNSTQFFGQFVELDNTLFNLQKLIDMFINENLPQVNDSPFITKIARNRSDNIYYRVKLIDKYQGYLVDYGKIRSIDDIRYIPHDHYYLWSMEPLAKLFTIPPNYEHNKNFKIGDSIEVDLDEYGEIINIIRIVSIDAESGFLLKNKKDIEICNKDKNEAKKIYDPILQSNDKISSQNENNEKLKDSYIEFNDVIKLKNEQKQHCYEDTIISNKDSKVLINNQNVNMDKKSENFYNQKKIFFSDINKFEPQAIMDDIDVIILTEIEELTYICRTSEQSLLFNELTFNMTKYYNELVQNNNHINNYQMKLNEIVVLKFNNSYHRAIVKQRYFELLDTWQQVNIDNKDIQIFKLNNRFDCKRLCLIVRFSQLPPTSHEFALPFMCKIHLLCLTKNSIICAEPVLITTNQTLPSYFVKNYNQVVYKQRLGYLLHFSFYSEYDENEYEKLQKNMQIFYENTVPLCNWMVDDTMKFISVCHMSKWYRAYVKEKIGELFIVVLIDLDNVLEANVHVDNIRPIPLFFCMLPNRTTPKKSNLSISIQHFCKKHKYNLETFDKLDKALYNIFQMKAVYELSTSKLWIKDTRNSKKRNIVEFFEILKQILLCPNI